jgi:pimeloyl-ACP methyl ester carboxylesterase
MQLLVDSLVTHYQVQGSGKKTVLLLHGWADTSATFDSLVTELTKHNTSYQFVVLDLPGFGKTDVPKSPWGLDDYAQYINAFCKKLKLNPEVIVGHSNGGAIAITIAAQGVLNPQKLVLIASAGVRRRSNRNIMLKIVSRPLKLGLTLLPATTQKRFKKHAYQVIGSDYMVAEHMQETFKRVVSTDVTAQAKTLNVPVCLIYGSDDTATPPQYGTIFKDAIGASADLHVIPTSTHFVHQEQVYKVANIMTEFIEHA